MSNTMTNSNSKNIPACGDLCIYDADDNVLDRATSAYHLPKIAREIATVRGEIVYYYDNGREAVEPAPAVGTGATVRYATDRHAGTVISVSKTGAKIVIRADRATRTDENGMSECQSYTFEPDTTGREWIAHRQGDGSYRTTGGNRVTIGVRNAYHDYSY